MLNRYRVKFFAQCPLNGARIAYSLTIETQNTIRVEEIMKRVSEITEGLHEEIAADLHESLGGRHTLVAEHHGVTIETERP